MAFNWFNNLRKSATTRDNDTSRQINDILNTGNQVKNNPNYRTFNRINNDIAEIVNARSIVSQQIQQQNVRTANPNWQVSFGEEFLAVPVATNKNDRINMYRSIAAYPVCRWCLDEIADDFMMENENGDFITLSLPDRLNATQQDIIQNEFKKYIGLFRMRDDGFSLVKRFLTEGELAWENVINPKYPNMGIIGVRFLPAEYYETLLDLDTSLPCGIIFDVEKFANDKRQMFSNNFAGAAAIFNTVAPMQYNFQFNKDTSVPLLMNQITYINSGEYSPDYLISYPLIENAKQQYHRLALLEDAAIILRVTHAPERLLFNVSTGKMTQNYADEYVRRFALELKSKKVASPDGKDVMGVYNPVTMTKNYVFGKSDGNDGTSVESVGSSANYDEMGDVEYFLRQMLKQFKVPWSRYKTPENTMEKNDAISYEEHAFARMIIRFQRRFADGFKRGFITHLKLKEIWDKEEYDMLESDIDIKFVKPILYDAYEQQKLMEIKMGIYKSVVDQEEFSKTIAMKKYLGMSDADIEENYKRLIKEKQIVAVGEFFAEQISEENPPVDFKSPIRLKKDVDAEEQIKAGIPKPPKEEGGGEEDEGSEDEEEDEGGEDEEEMEAEPAGEADFGLG